jgi:outer membrane protein assembly factor BamB
VASGSKDGSLYALDPDTGSLVWRNEVRPVPVTPDFAGFGLFNGAVGFADDRFHAALYQHSPPSSPAPEHLMAFDAVDGTTTWDEEIGASWGSVGIAGGVVWCGTQAGPQLLAHDAATGAPLVSLPMPAIVTAGPSVVDGVLYAGYGLIGAGGVRAYELP